MTTVSTAQIKELRDRTQCGMMDCKRALEVAAGDVDRAITWLREKGMAQAVQKAGMLATDGVIALQKSEDGHRAVLFEVNCQTDFVAKSEPFKEFVSEVARLALAHSVSTLQALLDLAWSDGRSVDAHRQELVGKIGENVVIRRFQSIEAPGFLGSYLHGVRIGVVVALQGGGAELAKEMAVHITASKPWVVNPHEVDAVTLQKEKDLFHSQAVASGKPAAVVEKMVEGRIKKFLSEVALVEQPFFSRPEVSVGSVLKDQQATVIRFYRFELGEGVT